MVPLMLTMPRIFLDKASMPRVASVAGHPVSNDFVNESFLQKQGRHKAYQHLMIGIDYKHQITEQFWLDYRFSFDLLAVEEYQFALGVEYPHETFGQLSPGFPHSDAQLERLSQDPGTWSSESLYRYFLLSSVPLRTRQGVPS